MGLKRHHNLSGVLRFGLGLTRQKFLLSSPEERYSPRKCWQPTWNEVRELTLKSWVKGEKKSLVHFTGSFAAIYTPAIQSHQPTQIPFLLTPVWVGFLSTVITALLIHGKPDISSFDLNVGLFLLYHTAFECNVFVQDSKIHILQRPLQYVFCFSS